MLFYLVPPRLDLLFKPALALALDGFLQIPVPEIILTLARLVEGLIAAAAPSIPL